MGKILNFGKASFRAIISSFKVTAAKQKSLNEPKLERLKRNTDIQSLLSM